MSSTSDRYLRIAPSDLLSFTLILRSSIMRATFMFAPPWRGPLSEPSDAAITEYVSAPLDDTTCVVKVELLPPPCSACSTSTRSSTRASVSV